MQPLSGRPPNTTIARSTGKAPLFTAVSVTSAEGFLCYALQTYLAAVICSLEKCGVGDSGERGEVLCSYIYDEVAFCASVNSNCIYFNGVVGVGVVLRA